MPADDLVLNVRQIEGYPAAASAQSSDAILIQRGGLGGPYLSIAAAEFVGTALAGGGDMAIGGALTAQSLQITGSGSAQFFNASVSNLFSAASATISSLAIRIGTMNGAQLATISLTDLLAMGGAPNFSPVFGGEPRAPTPPSSSHSSRLATTAFVHRNSVEYIDSLLVDHPFVFTFNGRSGDVVLTAEDIANAGGEFFDNVVLTGVPIAPTAPPGTDTTQLATTEFVQTAVENLPYAPIDSPQFTGYPSGPTAPPGSSTGQLATTAFVQDAITAGTAGVASFNTRTGAVILTSGDISAAGGALLASPIFTGVPQGPTAAPGTNTAQLATTAFVAAALGGGGVSSFNGRSGPVTLTTADITGAGGATSASPVFTGNPTAPTPAPGDSDTSIATTAYVMNAIASGGVTSFNTRTGSITLLASDISAAGGALLASPIFTGVPQAPTAAPTVATAQIATCAFVAAAIGGAVSSFNGRTGSVTLTLADLTGAGGAPIASPHFTGTPTAPTETAGDNTTALATTAFVTAAIAAGGVASFNGRTGSVVLTGADVSGAGGALIASPTFTGTPSAPTAVGGDNSTRIATTAYVMNALGTVGGVTSFNGRAGVVALTNADVIAVLPSSAATPLMNGAAAPGSGAAWSRGDHIHPSDTTRLPITGGTMTGQLVVNAPPASILINAPSGNHVLGFGSTTFGSVYWDVTQSNFYMAFGSTWARLQSDGSFAIQSATAFKPSGGTWTATSDERIKTIEGDYALGLDEISALRPVRFRYKGNDAPAQGAASDHASVVGKTFVGLIAQAVEPLFPGMVTKREGFIDGEKVDNLRTLDTSELVYALVNAVKALAARVQELETRMAT